MAWVGRRSPAAADRANCRQLPTAASRRSSHQHRQVLFALGPQHSYASLEARRAYFVLDLLSPWAALAAAGGVGAAPSWLLLQAAGHAALHAFYLLTWASAHTRRVLRLSSDDSGRRRFAGGYGALELAWFHVGTAFDLSTHAAVAWWVLRAGGA